MEVWHGSSSHRYSDANVTSWVISERDTPTATSANAPVEIREEEYGLRAELVDEDEVAEALRDFASLWESFSPREQARVIELLIERIDYDGANSTVSVTFRPAGVTGIKSLVDQMTEGDAA